MTKRRISASVDAELLSAVESAVKQGRGRNLSAWVSTALRRQLEHERRLLAMGQVIADFGREFGAITAKDIDESERWARSRAVRVGPGLGKQPRRRRSRSA